MVLIFFIPIVPIDIFLKSFPVQPGELKDKLLIVNEDDGGLSDEHITSLRRWAVLSKPPLTLTPH